MRYVTEMTSLLEAHGEEMLAQWLKVVHTTDMDSKLIYQNGKSMHGLVVGYLQRKISLEDIAALAHKVAQERVSMNASIEDFIYNVSLGRSILLQYMSKTAMTTEDLQPFINEVNQCFDHFLYHAVQQYINFKNSDLEAKRLFIEQSHQDRLSLLGQMSASFVHEVRNPLTSIMGFIRLLKHDYPDMKYLQMIEHELNELNYRIAQFLHVSKKAESPRLGQPFQLLHLLEETLRFLHPSISNNGVEVEMNVEESITLYGHAGEIKQVLINLIYNSIEALQLIHEPRRIYIEAASLPDRLSISIHNNGPKIPTKSLEVIFEPFVTTKDVGTGLGLFVCKQIIEAHGGKIHCESTDDLTRFTLEFAV